MVDEYSISIEKNSIVENLNNRKDIIMHILFVATEYIEYGKPTTGFPMYLYRVTQALIKLGHQPIIVTIGNTDSRRIEDNVEVFRIKVELYDSDNQNINKIINFLIKGYCLNKKIKRVCANQKIDIIQFTSLAGIALFYYGKVPAVMRLSSYAKTYFSSYRTFDKKEVNRMAKLERLSSRRCNAIFAPCRNTAEAFGTDIKRKVTVIETPFINDVKKYDFSIVHGQLVDKRYVLFFGTLYAEKGILIIADILEQFLKGNPQYIFVLAGDTTKIDGKDVRAFLYEKAGEFKDQVMIFPALSHNKLYPVIMNAECVVLPSLMDNFPNTCIEAMYFSKVVIGTDGASFEQLIEDGKNGFLCKRGDSKDLLNKIQKVINMKDEEKTKIEKNAQKRIKRLVPDIVVKKLIRYYEYIIKNSL